MGAPLIINFANIFDDVLPAGVVEEAPLQFTTKSQSVL